MRFMAVACFSFSLLLAACAAEIGAGDDDDEGGGQADAAPPGPGGACTADPDDPDSLVCPPDAAVAPPPDPPEPPPPPPPPPTTVDVELFLIGDCVTATCPPEAPYPVSCQVFFTPGDHRGCVASTPTNPIVYFQAGDACDEGLVTGTLRCATSPGAALDTASCPINKPTPIYAATSAGCPETH